MTITLKAGLASAALAVAAMATPALAGDLYHRGGMKDGGYEPMAHVARGPAGPCYFRGDLGYSVSRNPSLKWAVTNYTGAWDAAGAAAAGLNGVYDPTTNTYTADPTDTPGVDPRNFYNITSTYLGDTVTGATMDNAWFGGIGMGCSSGSYGLRGEVMLGYTSNRKVSGKPIDWNGVPELGVVPAPINDDPLHTSIKSYTAMVNVYKDFGNWGGITPYVGAGVGLAYNQMSEVYFTDNPYLTNRIQGDSKLSLAWSLMAGIGWQVTDRAVLDFGYRYMNYGKAQSGMVDSAGFVNPRVYADDLTAHEFKVGLRYHLGGSDCCAQPVHQPMK